MLENFRNIVLHESKQEPSQICLQNMVELIVERREEFYKIKSDYELIEQFPLVGYGLRVEKIKRFNKYTKYKVTAISTIERIIDESVLYSTNKKILKDQPNCILPLLPEEEDNRQLLKCDLYKRKMSQNLLGQLDKYEENSYEILLQSTLRHLIEIQSGFVWQECLKNQIFVACKQVFIGENFYYEDSASNEFKNSRFKLLNAYCLSRMNQAKFQEIFDNYVLPKFKRNVCINESKPNLQRFFDLLCFANPEEILKNVEGYIENYLVANQYFYFRLLQKSYLLNLIQELFPESYLKGFYQQIPFFNGQKLTQEEIESKQLIQCYLKASVYKKLFQYLIIQNKEMDRKKFKIFQDSVDDDQNYKTFLQNNLYYDFLLQLPTLLEEPNEFEFIKFAIKQVPTTRNFQIKEKKIKSSKKIFEMLISNCPEFCQGRLILQNLIQLFQLQKNENEIIQTIYRILSEIIWLNNSVSETKFRINQKLQNTEITNLLQKFYDFEVSSDYEDYSDAYLYNLTDISKFCFCLKLKTDNFQQNQLEDLEDYELEWPTSSDEKSRICDEIFKISKEYFKN